MNSRCLHVATPRSPQPTLAGRISTTCTCVTSEAFQLSSLIIVTLLSGYSLQGRLKAHFKKPQLAPVSLLTKAFNGAPQNMMRRGKQRRTTPDPAASHGGARADPGPPAPKHQPSTKLGQAIMCTSSPPP